MGDRHGGCFARQGRALSHPTVVFRRRAVVFRCPAVDFRWRGVVGRICPARERSPRRKPPDTAHEQKNLPRAGTRPSAKASRHGARAKEFAPREKALLDESFPTRRTGERICPAQKRSPRRKPPYTAHGRKDLPAQERSPRRRPPDTANGRKDLPAQKRSPRRRPTDTAHGRKDLPRGSSPSPHVPTNGGPPSTDGQPEKHPFGGVAPERARPLPSSFTEKK